MDWERYFAMMSDWKKLPAYRAEPRVDSLIGHYLPELVADCLGEATVGAIPELPLRLATINPDLEGKGYADRSYKVDFYVLAVAGTHYLIEFKTDQGSRREQQDWYLRRATEIGMPAIVQGICDIAKVSSYKKKYDHLLAKLESLGVTNDGRFSAKSTEVKVLYVLPRSDGSSACIDFPRISKRLIDKQPDSPFEKQLAKTLLEWSD